MVATITLTAAKQKKIIEGHPWVFPHAIQGIEGKVQAGTWVQVLDAEGHRIGAGFYNPHSLYRVRMLANQKLATQYSHWLDVVRYRMIQAQQKRRFMGLPNAANNAYRLCHSENDGLSGLTIDILNDVLVVSSTAYWVELYRELLITELKKIFPDHHLAWLGQAKSLRQDGWDSPYRCIPESLVTIIQEAGVQFEVHFNQIQKTGLYIDQRENHSRLAPYAVNKKVLDLYTYHGGFAIHAAKAGAQYVCGVDSSAVAIEHAQANAVLNQCSNMVWEVGDAKDYLAAAGDYDLIVLDPPKLVPSKKDLPRAKQLYRYLHRELFKVMREGSFLMTCNCSSALKQDEFVQLIHQQALALGKQIQIVGVYGPACCHPSLANFPEGQYLTAVLLTLL